MSDILASTIKHLRQIELDRMLAGEKAGLDAAHEHLETCQECRTRFERQRQEQDAHAGPKARAEAERLLSVAVQQAAAANRKRVAGVLGCLAAAAVVAVLCIPAFGTREAIPAYVLEISHGSQAMRDAHAPAPTVPKFAPHSRLRIDLRPARAFQGEIDTKVWSQRGQQLERVPLTAQISKDGAVRLEGVLGKDFTLPPGQHILWVFIFQDGDYDDEAAVRAALERGSLPEADGTILKTEVVIDADSETPASSSL